MWPLNSMTGVITRKEKGRPRAEGPRYGGGGAREAAIAMGHLEPLRGSGGGRVLPKCLLRDYSPVDRHLGLAPDLQRVGEYLSVIILIPMTRIRSLPYLS